MNSNPPSHAPIPGHALADLVKLAMIFNVGANVLDRSGDRISDVIEYVPNAGRGAPHPDFRNVRARSRLASWWFR